MRNALIATAVVSLAVACSSSKPAAKLDESGLARLNEAQMEPVDEARVEEGRARDALARARANEADARARLEVARTERSVAEAQMKRAQAERDLLKKQYASKDQMAEIDQEITAAQDRLKASDLKMQYLQQMIGVAEAERRAAEAHVVSAQALTEQAKYRAMKAANAPQASSVSAGDIDHRVAAAQAQEANLMKEVAERRAHAVDTYTKWQQADASARTLARPSTMSVPPPIPTDTGTGQQR
jgi:chromosome segregation ATPase